MYPWCWGLCQLKSHIVTSIRVIAAFLQDRIPVFFIRVISFCFVCVSFLFFVYWPMPVCTADPITFIHFTLCWVRTCLTTGPPGKIKCMCPKANTLTHRKKYINPGEQTMPATKLEHPLSHKVLEMCWWHLFSRRSPVCVCLFADLQRLYHSPSAGISCLTLN